MQQIYYVDKHDRPTGETEEKLHAHHADTQLHAAFSVYVFNRSGKFLVTQRALSKKVWPGVWTNSCCGHPAPNELRVDAVRRRLHEELGLSVKNIELVIPKYIYKTPPFNGVIEHEFCPIYVAVTHDEPERNPEEVEAYQWMDWQEYIDSITNDTDDYSDPSSDTAPNWSWWCKDQFRLLANNDRFNRFMDRFKSI